ncbi:hypothetical protein [Kitasatospora purpeofusca]|uniref:hypothetical protein n=1 Tax=Kitasatospora purpeofusca TaxID=67352 RepID=UPI0037FDA2C5
MTVPLFPPVSSIGAHSASSGAEPLADGPRFVKTQRMTRWHRVRSGVRYANGRTVYHLWCQGSVSDTGFIAKESLASDAEVCGPCDGRAVGAGQEPAGPDGRLLVFGPRDLQPPAVCPGSRSEHLTQAIPPGTVGRCLACLDLHPVRAMGGPYDPRSAITRHAPGAGLVTPCPFHRWKHLEAADGAVLRCACGRVLRDPASAAA